MIHILKAILEQAHAGIGKKKFSENKSYLSPGWKSMLGYQKEELEDSISAWQSHIFPEDLNPIRNEFEDYLKTDLSQPYEADIRFLHKNGNIIWFKCTCKVVEKDSLGKPILMIGTYFDVTKSKKIESELQHTVDRLALATRTAKVGIWDLDFTSGKISWDDTMFELYGTTREKFSGTVLDWESSLYSDDLERCRSEYAEALAGEKEFDTQFRIVWPDGSIHFIKAIAIVQRMASGKPFRMLGRNWDITKHKNAEIALKESYELAKVFIENAPSAIAMFDTNMKYMAASKQWLVDYYLGGIEIIGRSHYEIFPEIGDE